MPTATAHVLSLSNPTGTYTHFITFRPEGANVVITHRCHDELLGGNWMGGAPAETMTRDAARAYWRTMTAKRYRRS